MPRKLDPSPAFVRIDQARELLDRGRHQESLMVAFEALLQELNTLRDSLLTLKKIVLAQSQAAASETPKEEPQPPPFWLPPAKPRILH